jgi:hypothetical protein
VDGHRHRGLRDRLDLHGLAFILALDHHPAVLAAPVDLRVVLSAILLGSVVLILADLPVVPVLALQRGLAAAQVSVLQVLVLVLQVALAAAQALA